MGELPNFESQPHRLPPHLHCRVQHGVSLAFLLALSMPVSLSYLRAQSTQTDTRTSAITAERAGRNNEAIADWQMEAKAHPTSAEPYAHMGLLEARQQNYPDAIHYYLKARSLSPNLQGLSLNLGLAYFKNGDYQEAIAEFTPLLKAQNEAGSGNADEIQRLTVLMGMSHYGLSQFKEAAPLLKQASERDPTNLPLLLSLAHSCLLTHDYACVEDAYHQIIAQNAESAEADMLSGEALDEMGDTVSAIREFRAAVLGQSK